MKKIKPLFDDTMSQGPYLIHIFNPTTNEDGTRGCQTDEELIKLIEELEVNGIVIEDISKQVTVHYLIEEDKLN